MDCEYIQQNNIHEKYLLSQLSESDKNAYEKHIAECSSCKQELEKQKQVIAGIRTIGKQEMKNEIRMQVKEAKAQQKSSNWQMILKVAAVLLIIAVIPSAIYYFRTESGESLSELPNALKLETKKETYRIAEEPGRHEKSGQMSPSSPVQTDQDEESLLKKQSAPAIEQAASEPPASGTAMGKAPTEYSSDSMTKGRRISSREMAVLNEADDSIEEIEYPQSISAQAHSLQPESDEDKLEQALANGIKYQFTRIAERKYAPVEPEDIPTLQNLDATGGRKLTETYRLKEREGIVYPTISSVVFEAGNRRITVYFHIAPGELSLSKGSNLPLSFDVFIMNRDSLDWQMSYNVDEDFLDYDPSQMEIVVNDQMMYLTVLKSYIYYIDLESDSTQATLLKN